MNWTKGCAVVSGVIVGLTCSSILVIFGVLALIPAAPFHERNLTAGIVMLVLVATTTVCSVAGIPAAAIGACCGALLDDEFD